MTDIIEVHPLNAAKVKIDTEYHLISTLSDHFALHPPGYKFMKSYKMKIWDGFIRLFDARTRTLPVGLLPRLYKLAEQIEDTEVLSHLPKQTAFDVSVEEVEEFANSLNIHSKGQPITPHGYQIDAVYQALTQGRMVALAPTSAGKSLILYIFIKYVLAHSPLDHEKIMLIVPSIGLVHQMIGDFEDYETSSGQATTHPSEYIHLNMGDEKTTDKPVTISTWQSLQNFAKGKKTKNTEHIDGAEFLGSFTTVCVDEVHSATGMALTAILDQMVNAHIRLGVTGTLSGKDIMQLQLEGLFGPVYQVITTKELMDMGAVSEMDIKMVMLDYPQEFRKMINNRKNESGKKVKLSYQEEMDFIISLPERLKFIKNLALSLKGNTMILVQRVEGHGKPLYDAIRAAVPPDRKVFFISGKMDGKMRDEIRHIVDAEDDAIVVATYQTCQQGVSIRRLHNVIFGSPSKSQIRVLQSIGRGLRKGEGKTHCTLYDISDDFSWKSNKNYTLEHAIERIRMYAEVQFKYKLTRIPFPIKF